jgi:microcystin-dependent protein
MSSPYVGEIRMFGGNFAPVGWAFCDGSTMSISQNETLFNLVGTTYGGDGQQTFNLPDLRSRVPVHMGQGPGLSNYVIGQSGGSETVTLTVSQMPAHSHPAGAQSASGSQSSPANGVWAASTLNQYSSNNASDVMSAQSIQPAGGSQPHDNMLPFLCISFIISLFGIYPTPN